MADDEFIDYYALLKIAPTANQDEIERAYKHELRYWHPDKFGARPLEYQEEALRRTIALNQAYELLRDPDRRRLYDDLHGEWSSFVGVEYQRDEASTRTLLFPDTSLGTLWIRESGSTEWRQLGEASRRVNVSASAQLRLSADLYPFDLAQLRRLSPDTLHSLELGYVMLLENCTRKFRDADLESVVHLTGLKEISLPVENEITDAGISFLCERLVNLESLGVFCTHITNAALMAVGRLQGLSELSLQGMNGHAITDSGMRHLRFLSSLELLSLSDIGVSDEGLIQLSPLTKLKSLILSHGAVRARGAKAISGFTQLEELHADWTGLADDALEHISSLAKLEILDLTGTDISDASVPLLIQLNKLKSLNLTRTRITAGGVIRLREALPSCRLLLRD